MAHDHAQPEVQPEHVPESETQQVATPEPLSDAPLGAPGVEPVDGRPVDRLVIEYNGQAVHVRCSFDVQNRPHIYKMLGMAQEVVMLGSVYAALPGMLLAVQPKVKAATMADMPHGIAPGLRR